MTEPNDPQKPTRKILVVRLGALGDFFLSFPAFAAIRAHERAGEITLLTTAPFAALARKAPWFDRIETDARPAPWNLPGLARLARQLRGFDFVYDLQTSSRSSRYRLLAGRAGWSGIARGASHPHANEQRDFMHTSERQREQLEHAGITEFPTPDLAWLTENLTPAIPPGERFALLIPGASPHRPAKRWPVENFAELAKIIAARGIKPAVLGGPAETPLAKKIPAALDLTGQTNLEAIAALAVRAEFAVGNDTGPMHVAASVGCRCVVLFSGESDPALTAPRGPNGEWPIVLRETDLADLTLARVAAALP